MTTAAHRWDDRLDSTVRLRPPPPSVSLLLPIVYRAGSPGDADAGLAYRIASHAPTVADKADRRAERTEGLAVAALVVAGLALLPVLLWIGLAPK